jgi:hypothetical protein
MRGGHSDLPREAQLNCQMDYLAKTAIYETLAPQEIPRRRFPLKPICVFLGKNKLTSDKGERLHFWVHKQLARSRFRKADILFAHQFDKVDWDLFTPPYAGYPKCSKFGHAKK